MESLKRYKLYVLNIALIISIIFMGISVGAVDLVEYRSKKDCFKCGDSERNILNAYEDNGIGIIMFNNWGLSPFYLSGSENVGGNSTMTTGRADGSTVEVSTYNRRMAEAKISLRKRSKPLLFDMAEFLCIDCAKQIVTENIYDVAIINIGTREIKPLDKSVLFFMDDYALHIDWNLERKNNNINIVAFYAPELPKINEDEELRELDEYIKNYSKYENGNRKE